MSGSGIWDCGGGGGCFLHTHMFTIVVIIMNEHSMLSLASVLWICFSALLYPRYSLWVGQSNTRSRGLFFFLFSFFLLSSFPFFFFPFFFSFSFLPFHFSTYIGAFFVQLC